MRRLRQLLPLLPLLILAPAGTASAAAEAPPSLAFPVACTLGQTCWIQHYVDRDPSPGAHDYACGSLTYEGHNGEDIRIADMAAQRRGVEVLAAAPGVVLRLRDGVADISVRTAGAKSVEGQECGNGLVVDHGDGWETQYCHLAKGSLIVKPGDRVTAGQPLGRIGLSGDTEFPHLHFTVRHAGVVIDPFAPEAGAGATCGVGRSLWRSTPGYTPRAVINAGFAPAAVSMASIEAGDLPKADDAAPYLVAYVRVIGVRAGDQPSLVLFGPGGETLAPSPPATEAANADQRFLFVGKKRPVQGWTHGRYRARYEIKAAGQVVLVHDFDIAL